MKNTITVYVVMSDRSWAADREVRLIDVFLDKNDAEKCCDGKYGYYIHEKSFWDVDERESENRINEGCKIVVSKTGDMCIADRPELPGSPIVGYGKSPKEAIGDLIYNDAAGFNIQIFDEN